ncbi:hypothetical protein ACFL2V_16820, partial [Pseudomonadota bacterium]
MVFRRVIAALFVFVFILVSAVTFIVYGVSNTLLKPDFYRGEVRTGIHDYMVKTVSKGLIENDTIVSDNFTETDLRREISEVFSLEVFDDLDLPTAVQAIIDNPDKPYTLSLKSIRESMFTLANNLSYRLFENIPECEGGEVPEVTVKGLPTCVPEGVSYDEASRPFSAQFEKAIFVTIPDQIDINLSVSGTSDSMPLADVISGMKTAKYTLFVTLVVLIVFIALLIFGPFSTVMLFEGLAFMISGAVGYVFAYMMTYVPQFVVGSIESGVLREDTENMVSYIFSFLTAEIQKIAL